MTPQQREDAIDALSEIRQVIGWLEAGEADLEKVARVWLDNVHYLAPVLALVLPKRAMRQGTGGNGGRTDAA